MTDRRVSQLDSATSINIDEDFGYIIQNDESKRFQYITLYNVVLNAPKDDNIYVLRNGEWISISYSTTSPESEFTSNSESSLSSLESSSSSE